MLRSLFFITVIKPSLQKEEEKSKMQNKGFTPVFLKGNEQFTGNQRNSLERGNI